MVFVCNGSLQRWRQRRARGSGASGDRDGGSAANYFTQNRSPCLPRSSEQRLGRVRPIKDQDDFCRRRAAPAVEWEPAWLAAKVEDAIKNSATHLERSSRTFAPDQRRWFSRLRFTCWPELLLIKRAAVISAAHPPGRGYRLPQSIKHYGSKLPPQIAEERRRMRCSAMHLSNFVTSATSHLTRWLTHTSAH